MQVRRGRRALATPDPGALRARRPASRGPGPAGPGGFPSGRAGARPARGCLCLRLRPRLWRGSICGGLVRAGARVCVCFPCRGEMAAVARPGPEEENEVECFRTSE